MRILTSTEVRQAERQAISRPDISVLVLMQRAGYAAAQFCVTHFKFRSVCVVCGKGNNGGDGLVAAEALRQSGATVSVIILAKEVSELSADAAAMCARLTLPPIWITKQEDLAGDAVRDALDADLIIDAIVGTGFRPPLRGLARTAVEAINAASGIVVAVDLPSGVDADSKQPLHEESDDAVLAQGIVTFIAPKPVHVFGELTSGPIGVSEIGVQPALVSNQTELSVITGQQVGIAFPPRPQDGHKGLFGHLLVIAGSLGKAGAAALAGLAALRTGAGLVTVACPKSIQATVAGFAPELMTEGLPETGEGTISPSADERVTELLAGKDVIVLGPGLSQNRQTAEFVHWLAKNAKLPLVLDADGLNAFAGHYNELQPNRESFRVLTPHPGEAARLLGVSIKDIQANRLETAQRISRETGSSIVLKGARTIVAGSSGEVWINMTGNPALAKGGSGDVLSGIIGAALVRQTDTKGSDSVADVKASEFLKDIHVAAAVYLHGLTADIVRDLLHENSVLATDLIENLAEGFRECELQVERGLFLLQK